jgi:hypothetical protein
MITRKTKMAVRICGQYTASTQRRLYEHSGVADRGARRGRARVDGDGRYRIRGLESGSYTIEAVSSGSYRERRDIGYGTHATCIECPVSSIVEQTLNFYMRPLVIPAI